MRHRLALGIACILLAAAWPPAARAEMPRSGDPDRTPPRGDPRAAFTREVADLQAGGPRVPSPTDSGRRGSIVRGALALEPRPEPSDAARRHLAHGRRALERCACRDSVAYAVDEYAAALHEAPWWAEAYRRLGNALLRQARNLEAATCLGLYLEAEPQASDRSDVARRVTKLLKRRPAKR